MIPRSSSPDLALRARGLCFAYGSTTVLHDVDVELPWGTVTAVAGPNGAGKSTLVELLAGVLAPSGGRVERHDQVALVVQRPSTPDSLPVTVRDVVTMGTWSRDDRGVGRVARRARVEEALDQVGLADLADRPFGQLSGGQRQRALVGQGLARRAGIFLLDEPAAGLDAEGRASTRRVLAEAAARGAAVVCVSHDDESIVAADRVVRLEGGRRTA